MGHPGIMGIKWTGFSWLVGSTAFMVYLGNSVLFTPIGPKYEVPAEFAYMAKETQPGIVPEFYIKKKKENN